MGGGGGIQFSPPPQASYVYVSLLLLFYSLCILSLQAQELERLADRMTPQKYLQKMKENDIKYIIISQNVYFFFFLLPTNKCMWNRYAGLLILTHWSLVPSILRLGSMGNAYYSKIKSSSTG